MRVFPAPTEQTIPVIHARSELSFSLGFAPI